MASKVWVTQSPKNLNVITESDEERDNVGQLSYFPSGVNNVKTIYTVSRLQRVKIQKKLLATSGCSL